MKIKLNSARIVNITCTVILLIVVLPVYWLFQAEPGKPTISGVSSDVRSYTFNGDYNYGSVDPSIPDTLSYRRYMALKDSIHFSRMMQNGMEGSTVRLALTGLQKNERCDNCTIRDILSRKKKTTEYLLRLDWWRLDTTGTPQPTCYYVKQGQSYLRKSICREDRSKSNKYSQNFICNQVDIPVAFRYDSETKTIMIPITRHDYTILKPVFYGLTALYIVFTIYVVVGDFLKFLLDITAGEPFSRANVNRMRRIALILFALPVFLFLLNLLVPLFFHRYFMADIRMSSEAWQFLWKPLLLSAIFAMLYVAFRKGKQIQEENEGTI